MYMYMWYMYMYGTKYARSTMQLKAMHK